MSAAEANSWMEIAQSELFKGWQRWTSFACIWIWSCSAGILSARSTLAQQLPGFLAIPNEIVLLATSITLFAALLLSLKVKTIIGSRPIMIFVGALLSGGSIVAGAGIVWDSVTLFIAGLATGGVALAPLKIAWGEMYSAMKLQRGLISMGYSLVSSMIVVIIISGLSQELIMLAFICATIPCAHLAFQGMKKIEPPMEKEKHSSGSIVFSGALLLLPAIVALSYGVVKGLIPLMDAGDSSTALQASEYAELLVGALVLVFAYSLGKKVGPAQVYSVALIAVVAGLILVSSQSVSPWISFFIHDFGFTLFYFFMVVYWGDLSWRTGMPIVRVYTIGYFTFQFMNLAGSMLGYYFTGSTNQNHIILISLSIVLALFVVALLLFGNNRSSLRQWLIADEPSIEKGDEVPLACSEIAQKYNLSPREQEVLSLLARGRNASYIARTLYISPDTAKTHIKNIYRKLDVHTQQNLIDFIEKRG